MNTDACVINKTKQKSQNKETARDAARGSSHSKQERLINTEHGPKQPTAEVVDNVVRPTP